MTTPADRARQRACIIIPAFNEAARIAAVVCRAKAHCPDVVVVDDGSSDRTAATAEAAGATVVRHPQNRGKGVALQTGFAYARERGFDIAITLDADGQHNPDEIPRFLEAYARTGIPVLIGNRMADAADMPRVRRWTNQFMSWMLSRAMRQYVPDTQCGYRLFRCDVIPFIGAASERFAAESEILLNVAARGIQIGAVRIATIYGDEKSKIRPFSDTIRFFSMLLRHRQRRRKT